MADTKTTRTETDAFGPIEIASDKLWGAQTQRSVENFRIGGERMPLPLVHALGLLKRAAADVNRALGPAPLAPSPSSRPPPSRRACAPSPSAPGPPARPGRPAPPALDWLILT